MLIKVTLLHECEYHALLCRSNEGWPMQKLRRADIGVIYELRLIDSFNPSTVGGKSSHTRTHAQNQYKIK